MAAAAPNPEDSTRSSSSGGTSTPSALAGDGDAEEAEDFTSSSHCSELSRRQNEQRKQGLFCDVTLAFSSGAATGSVQSCEFSAHRSVLSAATDYFTPLLGGQFSESLSGRVEMKEWSSELGPDPETVESVIQYMYTGEIRVSTCNVHEVLELADRYDQFIITPLSFRKERINSLSIGPFVAALLPSSTFYLFFCPVYRKKSKQYCYMVNRNFHCLISAVFPLFMLGSYCCS